MRVALALLATVAMIAAVLAPPSSAQASDAPAGEMLAWVESYDAFDASAGLVDAAVADRVSMLVATAIAPAGAGSGAGVSNEAPVPVVVGACRPRQPTGLPSSDTVGCDLPKAAGDLPEVEPPRAVATTEAAFGRRVSAMGSDPSPRQAPLQRPLRPPSA